MKLILILALSAVSVSGQLDKLISFVNAGNRRQPQPALAPRAPPAGRVPLRPAFEPTFQPLRPSTHRETIAGVPSGAVKQQFSAPRPVATIPGAVQVAGRPVQRLPPRNRDPIAEEEVLPSFPDYDFPAPSPVRDEFPQDFRPLPDYDLPIEPVRERFPVEPEIFEPFPDYDFAPVQDAAFDDFLGFSEQDFVPVNLPPRDFMPPGFATPRPQFNRQFLPLTEPEEELPGLSHEEALQMHREAVDRVQKIQLLAAQQQGRHVNPFLLQQLQQQQLPVIPPNHFQLPTQQQPTAGLVNHFNLPGADRHQQFNNELRHAEQALLALQG